jgi:hypothetical protein
MAEKNLKGCGMACLGLDFARRMQLFYDMPDVNVCFTPDDLLKKIKKAEKGENFILIEGEKN